MKAGLPYFNILLDALERGKPGVTAAFGAHVHWGYWDAGDPVEDSAESFAAAAERMSERVCDVAGAGCGQRILDVGCGFGGTVASLDRRFSEIDVVGVNNDGRQLARARARVAPRPGNKIEFVEADACALPFPDASFDRVLAVECIFHFPSRRRFFHEARRVLRPGGRLVVSDFVPARVAKPLLRLQDVLFGRYIENVSGAANIEVTEDGYHALARDVGLVPARAEDITRNTLPTYPAVLRVIREAGAHVATATFGAIALEAVSRARLLRYLILPFSKPNPSTALS